MMDELWWSEQYPYLFSADCIGFNFEVTSEGERWILGVYFRGEGIRYRYFDTLQEARAAAIPELEEWLRGKLERLEEAHG